VARSGGDKEAQRLVAVLEKCVQVLDQAQAGALAATCTRRNWAVLKPLCLITAKPTMYVANVDEDGFENNPHLEAVRQVRGQPRTRPWWPSCAAIEAEIADLSDEDKADVPRRHRAWRSRA
jgi:ribosome-binding ATPase YchF (GTP1/OBG family)